jgi:molybdopterin synthase catalytic subunit
MIDVTIKYFAVLREVVGHAEETRSYPEGTTVSALLEELEGVYPALAGKRDRLSVAVNHQYASGELVLQNGAELALLPPVAGGMDVDPTEGRYQVLETPLSPELVSSLVKGDFGGAVGSFVGMVRAQSQGRTVERLDYEAYRPMAVKELQRIGREVEERWPQASVAIHHRIGSLTVGELAVVIAVCTPHRQAGFEACSHTIERLKESVPIWKKEFFTDGSTWVGWGP